MGQVVSPHFTNTESSGCSAACRSLGRFELDWDAILMITDRRGVACKTDHNPIIIVIIIIALSIKFNNNNNNIHCLPAPKPRVVHACANLDATT